MVKNVRAANRSNEEAAVSVQAKTFSQTFAQTFAHLSRPELTVGDLRGRNHAVSGVSWSGNGWLITRRSRPPVARVGALRISCVYEVPALPQMVRRGRRHRI